MAPSDPFDDDDDLFFNAETLNMVAAAEEKAIRASQMPIASQSSTPAYHHKLAKPKQIPAKKVKEPRPLNTEPRAGNSGFGWEYGGKRSIEGNVERHLKAIEERQAYWSPSSAFGGGKRREDEEEDAPPDVVMDESGRYGLALEADEAVVTDNRKAQQAALEETLLTKLPLHAAPPVRRENSVEAAAARRKAIAEAAMGGPLPLVPRPPLSRSNSASSNGFAGPSRLNSAQNNGAVQPTSTSGTAQKFSTNRPLSRSISAGGQVFNRANAAAGPSRLPAIPSQIIEVSPQGSQGAPSSQGSAARQAAIELEQERRKRQELEAELSALRAQASKPKPVPQANGGQPGTSGTGGDAEKRAKDLQAEVWRAKGEAETMRRAREEEHNRHLAEIEKLRAALADKDVQIKERETMQKRAVENIKHQAVFSNHALQNSAMKSRHREPQQSQRFGSSQRPQVLPTPVRHGSPGRQLFDNEITPLVKSVKGKGKAPPPPPPAFGGFSNAFAATPTVARVKRQRTEAPSPGPQPLSSPPKAPTPSPSKAPDRDGASSPVFGDPGEAGGYGMGGEVADLGRGAGMDLDQQDELEEEVSSSDERAQLLYHLFNHVSSSSFQQSLDLTSETTLYRIINYRPPLHADQENQYAEACSNLLKGCGAGMYDFEELSEMFLDEIWTMLTVVEGMLRDIERITIREIAVLCSLLSLLSSTVLLFPSCMETLPARFPGAMCKDITLHLFSDPTRLAMLRDRFDKPADATVDGEDEVREKRDAAGWHLELADVLVEFCEVITFCGAGTHVWEYEQLVDVVLYLTSPHQDRYIVQRGLDLFYTASCFPINFKALTATSDVHKLALPYEAQSPLIERLSRWLINPFPQGSYEECLKQVTTSLRGLCMLAIANPDAAILMGQRSILVYALILVLQRESTKIWGVHAELHSVQDALKVLHPALALLHHLVFPSPLSSSTTNPAGPTGLARASSQLLETPNQYQRRRSHNGTQAQHSQTEDGPIGINLPDRLRALTSTNAGSASEFNGLQHVFVSALGCMAYGGVDEEVLGEGELRSIQFLAQDLLETVIEGPEGDSIFEIYVADDDDPPPEAEAEAAVSTTTTNDGGDEQVQVVDVDAYEYAPMELDE